MATIEEHDGARVDDTKFAEPVEVVVIVVIVVIIVVSKVAYILDEF